MCLKAPEELLNGLFFDKPKYLSIITIANLDILMVESVKNFP